MKLLRQIRSWLRGFLYRSRSESEMDTELRFHLEARAEDLIRTGIPREEAFRRARIEFGGVENFKEECREARRANLIESFVHDIHFGFRVLRKSPGFTAIAVLTLALGIGANSALFSIVNAVLLDPLPYPHADRLYTIHESKPNFPHGSISYLNFLDWRRENHTLAALAVHRSTSVILTGMGQSERLRAEMISYDLFPMLGVQPLLGRNIAENEDRFGGPPVVLLSQAFWKRRFGGSPDTLGKGISLDGREFTIIGVVPGSFHFNVRGFRNDDDVYFSLSQWNNTALRDRTAGLGIHGLARLKPGVTIEQAQADMDSVTQGLAAEFPDADKGIGASFVSLRAEIVEYVQSYLLLLLGAVGFVLLIASVNVANLLLARSSGRTHEFAVRGALGASRGRIIRQLLAESVLLAVAGGTLGLALAVWGTQAALHVAPVFLPRSENVHLDGRVLLFTAAITLLVGVIFGLAPAMKSSKAGHHAALKETSRTTSRLRQRMQSSFVVAEVAMALVLLAGAGLMLRSLSELWRVNPGFNPHNVLTFSVLPEPSLTRQSPEAIRGALRNLRQDIAGVPGVQSAALSWGAVPLVGDDELLFWHEGQPKPTSTIDMNWAINYIVEPDYFQAMQIPLESGRYYAEADNERSARVVVVDDVFAQKYFPGRSPLGKRINLENYGQPAQIVGVVGHVKQWGLDNDDRQSLRAEIYMPFMQMRDFVMPGVARGMDVVVRSNGDPSVLFGTIRQALSSADGQDAFYGAETMDGYIADSLAARKFSAILLAAFAGLALLLASIGLYGVISYLVGQRTHEIGIRMALGARPADVLRQVLAEGARLALIGLAIGVVAALALTRLMADLLYGVAANDPLTFVAMAAVLMAVALAACYIPARRAMRVDPMVALRYE